MTFKANLNLGVAKAAADEGAAEGLTNATEFLLTEANLSVPHEDGDLERSGRATVDKKQQVGAVSYDTPYAVRQHEETDYSHDGKGEAKWLENTMTRERQMVAELVAQGLRSRMGG